MDTQRCGVRNRVNGSVTGVVMRTVSSAQTKILNSQSRKTWIDVQVYVGSVWVSMASLFGFNFIQSLTWSDQIDDAGPVGTVTLWRNIYYYNLSPLVVNSKINLTLGVLTNVNTPIKIFVAPMPQGTTPQNTDYVEVFYGRIYQTDWSDYSFTIQIQDWCGQLQSTWLENSLFQFKEPNPAEPSQTTMQRVLDAVNALPGVNLVLANLYSINGYGAPGASTNFLTGSSPDDPGWALLNTATQTSNTCMATYTALDNINQQIGWVLRQKWNNNVNAWVLTWFDPLRSNTTSTWTFNQSTWLAVNTCGLHLGDIRNVISIIYTPVLSGTLPTQYYSSGTTLPEDSVSVAKYGRQFMQIGQESTGNITADSDAGNLAANCLSDLSQQLADFEIDTPLFWPVELNDIYTFTANGIHFDSDQTLAVVGYSHSIDPNGIGKTTLTMRGKPTSGVQRWFNKQAVNPTRLLGASNQNIQSELSSFANASMGQYSKG